MFFIVIHDCELLPGAMMADILVVWTYYSTDYSHSQWTKFKPVRRGFKNMKCDKLFLVLWCWNYWKEYKKYISGFILIVGDVSSNHVIPVCRGFWTSLCMIWCLIFFSKGEISNLFRYFTYLFCLQE